jgi:peptidoglycan-associated lipoprotein
MRKQILSLAAVAALLAACTDTCDENKMTSGGFDNFPAPSASTAGPTPGSAADFQKNVKDTVHFGYDRFDLTAEAKTALQQQAEWLKKWAGVNLLVEGHCDERGTVEYNLALGEKRANAVKNFLVSNGIEAKRLETVSYGKERPVDAGHTEEAHAKNRRGVSVVR